MLDEVSFQREYADMEEVVREDTLQFLENLDNNRDVTTLP